jgi:KipI family sensor histidine kinase inhibitor
MTRRLLPYGDEAVLIELANPTEVLPLRDFLVAQVNPAIRAVVPAARTVLVEFDPLREMRMKIAELVDAFDGAPADTPPHANAVDIPVSYDGPDLSAVAAEISESTESVIARHTAPEYTVQFCGFSPGFAYLTGLDPVLQLARLTTPRPAVPAGSVAIAAEYTGIYPRSSPGGWRLLGTTDAVLFDLNRATPALLTPGTRVRFVRR